MNQYMISAWTFTSVLVNDLEMEGADVVLGTFEGRDDSEAKQKAAAKHNIPFGELSAYQVVTDNKHSVKTPLEQEGEKTFIADVSWSMGKQEAIKANSLEEAMVKAQGISALNGVYVDDSFVVDDIQEIDED